MTLPEHDDARFYHEPRALWTVTQLRAYASEATKLTGRVEVPKDAFRNVSKYPMTLTHMLMCGVNYTFWRYLQNPLVNIAGVHNGASMIDLIDVFVSAPYSFHITNKDGRIPSLPAAGRGEPPTDFTATSYESGVWGKSRWNFDRPLVLGSKGTIQFDVSAITMPNIGFDLKTDPPDVRLSLGFDELHTGKFGGNNRVVARAQQAFLDSAVVPQNAPFPLDGFAAAGNGTALTTWNPAGFFQAREWHKQETDRGQAVTHFRGFDVAIDQIDYDEQIQTVSAAAFAGFPICPLSMRTGVRARTINCGSGEWWWQPGAPLALVCPTITPAQVFKLPQEITLGPGEQLEVELQAPLGPTLATGGEPVQYRPYYNVGLSFTGYASIEG